ncbi:hypothetical protein AKJ45_02015 [candidate division MSBL1 archaeon SCGC-AAA261F19]|uniref:Uncharacterized protein n=2 Tax=candidate division MSBL1 TaxID=215777 RepID=A0A133VA17_9EURY|nr:hypothetical protein AKJ43_01835 [candidate division MSBL1 archaeon SCGC-AAA261D19]KXB03279.1 hypothetical protein AKJ45_02015 [candidate division MSBL1 archaeon SCGC-AAA261F19]
MDEGGWLTGFLTSKLGVALTAISLIGASIAMYGSFERTVQGEQLNAVADSTAAAFHTVCSLPGRVHLRRELPSIDQSYTITISGSYESYQTIRILVAGRENVSRTLFIEEKVNGGDFDIERKGPRKIRITKSSQILVEVI